MVQGWNQKMLTFRHGLMWDQDRVLLGWGKFHELRHSALWFSQLLHGRVVLYWMASVFVGRRYNHVLCTKVHISKFTNGAHLSCVYLCVCACVWKSHVSVGWLPPSPCTLLFKTGFHLLFSFIMCIFGTPFITSCPFTVQPHVHLGCSLYQLPLWPLSVYRSLPDTFTDLAASRSMIF